MSELSTALVFTENAALKVHQLIQEEGNLALNLRVFISGGGCSGFQYGFTYDEQINADDMIVETPITGTSEAGETVLVKLLIDAMSFQYLAGAKIDYRDDLEGARFVISNPNAQTTCGCGSSFSA
jgi:iron-sulfur cluster insertion protein